MTMEKTLYSPITGGLLAVPVTCADQLLHTGDGAAALVYLWLLRNDGRWDAIAYAAATKQNPREAEQALRRLVERGLVQSHAAAPASAGKASVPVSPPKTQPRQPLAPAQELPEYTAQDIETRVQGDAVFAGLVQEVQRMLGRMLSGGDLKTLFGIYDYIALPAEVILQLVQYCIDFRKGNRMPGLRQIEKEAYAWADMELVTLEQVEAYIRRRQERTDRVEQFREELQLRGRAMSDGERRYLESWADWGFGVDAVALAYDRTVLQTGGLKWPYMNSILKRWHEAGLHSLPEIQQGDRRPGQAPRGSAAGRAPVVTAPSAQEQERMKKLLENING